MNLHIAFAKLTGTDGTYLVEQIIHELESTDQHYEREGQNGIIWDTGIGVLKLNCDEEGTANISAMCETAANLYMLREAIHFRVEQLSNGADLHLEWSKRPSKLDTPPNFRTVELIHKTHIGANFIRLRFAADDLDDFAKTGLHFRLLLPPNEKQPVWPSVNSKGQTNWPVGEDALHTPAYTFRNIDPAQGVFDVDIYAHGNGQTCAWAEAAQPGQVLGISGPGGGWIPQGESLFLCGDETALPAIARIIENLDPSTEGYAVIETGSNSSSYFIANNSKVDIIRFTRKNGHSDLKNIITAMNPLPKDFNFAWFAGEKKTAQFVREYFRDRQSFASKNVYVASYWQRTTLKNTSLS